MTLQRPIWMQPASGDPDITYSAQALRALFSSLIDGEGVFRGADGELLVHERAAGADFTVEIDPGSALIVGDDVAGQGPYTVTSDAVVSRTIPAAPASGTVVHRVVARIRDKLHNSVWTGYDWDIQVLEDTGTGTPATPSSAISLALVSVAASQTSVTNADITDDRSFLQRLGRNTGRRTDFPISMAAGFALNEVDYWIVGPILFLHLWVERTGTALQAGSEADPNPGNLPDTEVATITDPAFGSAIDVFGTFRASVTSGAFGLGNVNHATLANTIQLADAHTDSTIKTGDTCQFSFMYPLAGG